MTAPKKDLQTGKSCLGICGGSSTGRAAAFQAACCGFESRPPLHEIEGHRYIGDGLITDGLSYDPNTVNRQRPTSRKSLVYLRYQIRTCVPGDHHETDVLMHSLISADTAARAARTSVLPA